MAVIVGRTTRRPAPPDQALTESAQAKYFEPSDWQAARFVAHEMDRYIRSARPSSQMFAALMSAMSDLLVTEGTRRRVRIEIEREQAVV